VPHAGVTPTAVFDFDNTIIGGDVFFDFVVLLLLRAELPPTNAQRVARLFEKLTEGAVPASSLAGSTTNQIVSKALGMVKDGKLSLSNCFFLVIGALTGVRESVVTDVARELFVVGLPGQPPYATKFFNHDKPEASAETLIRTLINRGVAPHIITLGLPTVAREGAKLIGVPPNHVHGFELEVIDGIITGRAVNARLIGKHIVTDRLVSRYPLFCFGDAVGSDTPMLARATVRGFAVNPDAEFKAHIAKNHADLTGLAFTS
jgi:phosphoserine phosphatase